MKYHVITDHPVAVDSRDHTHPGGTMHDSSRNPAFNRKLFQLFGTCDARELPARSAYRVLRVMDLGCAGGSFVKDMLDAGHQAIGLEGSDYSTKWDGPGGTEAERARRKPGRRAEWANIPENLFTADITKPFQVHVEIPGVLSFVPMVARFDAVTSWEVMEHLPEQGLPQLIDNVKCHLAEGGVWIMSVSSQQGEHHMTVKPRQWWLDLFASHGLAHQPDLVRHFGDDWVRGPNQNAPESFHIILKRK